MTDSTTTQPQRAMIVDDHPAAAMALESILNELLGAVEVRRATTIGQALTILEHFVPGLVFLDLDLPDSKGVVGLHALRAAIGPSAQPQFVIWSGSASSEHMRACYEASAVGYIWKAISIDQIRHAIGCVLHEGSYWPSGWDAGPILRRRERQVLQLLGQGKSKAAIATELQITDNTVKSHLKSLYHALNVSKAVAAVAKARQLGLID
jgi:DNA-binding NarL/FixJ family response regulator